MAIKPLFDDIFDGNLLDNTTLDGGADDDIIVLDNGNDNSNGGDGNDFIFGNGGIDTLSGGIGDDQIFGGDGEDTLNGGDDNDQLDGGSGKDNLVGGIGDDTYFVDRTDDVVTEDITINQGTDNVQSSATFTLSTNIENLFLTGNLNINGTGNFVANTIIGNDGRNALVGFAGDDTLLGGNGDDSLFGGGGHDIQDGGSGTDRLFGGTGDDGLLGGEGIDTLSGLDGNDVLNGGLDRDSLDGGLGQDLFQYTDVADSEVGIERDTIIGFVKGQDLIDLSAIDANIGGSDDPFIFRGAGALIGGGEVKYFVSGLDLIVRVELEGDGNLVADMDIKLAGAASITLAATDFIL